MGNSWLLKTEPSTYSWQQLLADKRTTWDGISAPAALLHLRNMKAGDEALIYHSGDERAIVGIAKILKGPYPDPKLDDSKRVVVDVAPVRPIAEPVTLAQVKAVKGLSDFGLVRISRLSTMPVSTAHRKLLEQLGVR